MDQPRTGVKLDPHNIPPRDAIHVAIMPVIVGESCFLTAGSRFRLKPGTSDVALNADYNGRSKDTGSHSDAVGVIDPFLPPHNHLKQGDVVYGFLFPQSITGMRHHWKHPLIDEPAPGVEKLDEPTEDHEAWLRSFASSYNMDYDEMIEAAQTGDYILARGHDLHGESDLADGELYNFWRHIEGLTKREFDEKHRSEVTWTCTC